MRTILVALVAAASFLALAVTGSGAPGPSARIAYIGTDAIYLANIDGTGRELVVRGVSEHTTLAWSPNGRRLAFSGGHRRAEVIFSVNLDGSGVKRLTRRPRGPEEDYSENPSWSPNGKWIAFDGARTATGAWLIPDIFVTRADGRKERRIAGGRAFQWNPVWSPDGGTILYEQFVGSSFKNPTLIDLYLVNPDGTGRRRLTRVRNEANHCACPVWSPDGTRIAYEAEGTRGRPDIYVMNADGSDRRQLTNHRARDENPDWSPDGTQIAFYSERVGNAEIYVMNADGLQETRVTRDPWYNQAVRWEPAPPASN